MKVTAALDVYKLFDKFIENCLIMDGSLDSRELKVVTEENLKKIEEQFVGKYDNGKDKFEVKAKEQFKDSLTVVKECFGHLLWLWALPSLDIKPTTKKEDNFYLHLDRDYPSDNPNLFIDQGIANTGQYHKTNKYLEIKFLLELVLYIKEGIRNRNVAGIQGVKEAIEKYCLDTNAMDRKVASRYLILNLTRPGRYEAIAAHNHLEKIYNTFSFLLRNDEKISDISLETLAEKIYEIREKIGKYLGDSEFSFYDKELKPLWLLSNINEEFSPMQGLKFKKSIIFYGPPGTGKTFEAKELAREFILRERFHSSLNKSKSEKDNILKEILSEDTENAVDKFIHEFQFHPNTTYDEFVIGKTLKNNSVENVDGYLLKIIGEHEKNKLPVVIILDEINRVDLSSVFGEVMSLIEYRNKSIKISVDGREIRIPDNFYFIGTMNEIDFSLERIDFALRRRFLWFAKGYSELSLIQMIENKLKEKKLKQNSADIILFAKKCTEINKYIKEDLKDELGEKYEIGHAFLSEIVDIYCTQFEEEDRNDIGVNKKGTKRVLWNISIKPLLEVYLGNIDNDRKDKYIADIEKKLLDVEPKK